MQQTRGDLCDETSSRTRPRVPNEHVAAPCACVATRPEWSGASDSGLRRPVRIRFAHSSVMAPAPVCDGMGKQRRCGMPWPHSAGVASCCCCCCCCCWRGSGEGRRARGQGRTGRQQLKRLGRDRSWPAAAAPACTCTRETRQERNVIASNWQRRLTPASPAEREVLSVVPNAAGSLVYARERTLWLRHWHIYLHVRQNVSKPVRLQRGRCTNQHRPSSGAAPGASSAGPLGVPGTPSQGQCSAPPNLAQHRTPAPTACLRCGPLPP